MVTAALVGALAVVVSLVAAAPVAAVPRVVTQVDLAGLGMAQAVQVVAQVEIRAATLVRTPGVARAGVLVALVEVRDPLT